MFVVFSRVGSDEDEVGLSNIWVHCCFVCVAFEKGSRLPLE